jgi:type VI secretion system protein ImpL
VRARLSVATLARRGYDMVRSLPVAEALPIWRVIDHAGPSASRVLLRPTGRSLWDGIDGLYTRAGFFEVFLPASANLAQSLAKEGWVLGEPATGVAQPLAAKRLRDDMLALYLDDYIRAWDKLLADIAIVPFRSAEHAADVLNILAGPNSPLKKLLQGISQETNLDPAPKPADAAGAKPEGASAAQQAAAQAAQGVKGAQQVARLASLSAQALPAPGHPVTLHFADLHEFADSKGGAPSPLDGVIKSMGELYRVFNRLSAGTAPLPGAAGSGAAPDAVIAELRASSAHLPPPVNQLFGAVAASGGSIVTGGARDYFTKIWHSTVMPHCRQAVDGRFPFVATSAEDTPVDDFAQLFAPEGEIAKFFNTYLKPFANTAVTPWRWQKADGVALGLSPDVLAQFERAADIGATFFAANPKKPGASFEIAPLLVDPSIITLRLTVDGQLLQYQHGPLTPVAMQWPSAKGPPGAALSFVPSRPPPGQPSGLNEPGPWGLLRLVAAAHVTKLAPDRYRLDFTLSGRTATLTLKAAGLHNPFDLALTQQFSCPAW